MKCPLAWLLAAVALCGPVRAQPGPRESAAPLLEIAEVLVVPGSISISSIVRISVRNNSGVERLVCVGALHLTLRPVGDAYAEGGVRDCQQPDQFIPVAAGGMHLVQRSVLRTERTRDASIQLGILLFHAPADDSRAVAMIDLAWDGPMAEAEEAGRR